ncbi:Serine-aspartate repeat-containing protein D precursor [Corynebacterium imitans]|uniref:alpha-amylase n=1 Tax=Corynebacterium imitans TaxID=156978 RepID=A0A239Y5B8_9CORY|nr:Serine-aspartate repeat-containing protein D precursor [Corynebacterium imitans]
MRGNPKPSRGLFSGMKRTVIASATALSLAVGGMAVPALPTPTGESVLPVAAAQELAANEMEYKANWRRPLNTWPSRDINASTTPDVLREMHRSGKMGWKAVTVTATKTYTADELIFTATTDESNSFPEDKKYFVWVERHYRERHIARREVKDGKLYEIAKGHSDGRSLKLTLPETITVESGDTLVVFGEGVRAPGSSGSRPDGSVTFEVTPKLGTVTGKLNAPVSFVGEALVDLLDANGNVVETKTVRRGQTFTFADTPIGDYKLKVRDTRGFTGQTTSTFTLKNDATENRDLSLTAQKASAYGWVKDEDGNAVPNAEVTLSGASLKTTTNSNGYFNIPNIPDGQYTVEVAATERTVGTNASVTLKPGDNKNLDQILVNLHRRNATGRVLDEQNNPVSGAELKLSGNGQAEKTVKTDAEGNYRFEGLKPGTYTVEVKGSTAYGSGGGQLDIQPERDTEKDFKVSKNKATLSGWGSVVGSDEKPANVELKLWGKDADGKERVVSTATTSEDGTFSFAGVEAGTYAIEVVESDRFQGGRTDANIDVKPGESKRFGLQMVYKTVTATGLVTLDREQLKNVDVTVTQKATGKTISTRTDDQGRFTIMGLDHGAYTASIAAKPGSYKEKQSAEVNIEPGKTGDLSISLASEPGNVEGTVTDNFGKPVAGAKVTAGNKSATTGKDGKYRIEGLSKGNVTVTVARSDQEKYSSASKSVEIQPEKTRTVDLQVARDRGTIIGTVKDDDGTVLADGKARVTGPNGFNKEVTISGGKYELGDLIAGKYTVTVAKTALTDAKSEEVNVAPGQTATKNIEVRRFQGAYQIRVFDDLGKPIQGAKVEVTGKGFKQQKQTDAKGDVSIENVPPGRYAYKVLAADEYGQASGDLNPIVEDSREALNVGVPPTDGRVEGTVLDDAGAPVVGATVKLDGNRRSGNKEVWSATATTDDNGKYAIPGVPPGTFTAKVDATDTRGGDSTEVTVRPNAASTGDLELNRNDGSLGGKVTDDTGAAVSGAQVVLKDAAGKQIGSAETNDDGVYEFADLRPGEYLVEVVGTDKYGAASENTQVEPAAKGNRDLRVSRADGSVEGKVVDEEGVAVEGASVTIYGDGVEEQVTTNAEGTFTVSNLRPGSYRVEVAPTKEYGAAASAFTVEPGATATAQLEVNRSKSTVTGQVSDDAHQVIEGVEVEITDAQGTVIATETTGGDGTFSVKDVKPGTYTATVEGTDTHEGDSYEFTVVAGEFPERVPLIMGRKAGTLRGQVVDAVTGKAITNATLTLVAAGETEGTTLTVNGKGEFQVPVAAGTHTLRVQSPEFYEPYSDQIFEVGAAERVDLGQLKLVSTVGSIEGTVTDGEGNALEGVELSIRNLENGAETSVTTNAKGKYTAGNRTVGRYEVAVTAPQGYDAPETQEVPVERSKTATADFKVNKTPEAPQVGSVSGAVLDTAGEVVDGASVALKHRESGEAYPATVNAKGRFSAKELPAGEYSVIASADGYKAEGQPRVKVEAGKNRDIGRINLVKDEAPQGTFRVIVRSKDQKKPVAKAVIVVSQGDDERSYVTDANGEARGQLPVGTYSVRTTPPANSGFITPEQDSTLIIERGEPTDLPIELDRSAEAPADAPTGRVTGSIADENGEPVEGTTAKLRGEDGTIIDINVDENGNFVVEDVPEGKYTLIVTPGEGHRTPRYKTVEVNRGETTDVGRITTPSSVKKLDESDKGEPGTINGWLVDEKNEPIPGATVIVRGKGTDTDPDGNPIDTLPAVTVDENGRFTTDVLPEGDYEIDLELPEGWDKPEGWPKNVNVTKDKPEHQGVINVVAPRSEIKGAVVDGNGNPIDGVVVTVTDSHGDTKEVPVDENGNYKLDVIPGDAVVEVFTPEGVQEVDPMYIPVRPKNDVALPTVNLTEKTLDLKKRVLGWDADTPEDAPGLPTNEDLIYGFVVTNDSDEPVHNVKIEDPFAGPAIKAPENWDGTLQPGETKVFTAVMKPPYGSGAFANIAVARGFLKNEDGSEGAMVASTPDEAYLTFMDMSLMKKVNAQIASDPKKAVRMAADRDLYFTYEVVNTGSTRMENVKVTDMIYEGDKDDFDPDNPGKGRPMKIIPPKGFTGTLLPGERAVFKGVLPPLKPGIRHHNAAEASGEAPPAPKRSRIFEEEPDYGDDPSGLLVISPKENIDGNAHIVVEEGAALPAVSDLLGKLYIDSNKNGKLDDGDEPYGGMDITLQSRDGQPAVGTTSLSDGSFEFKGVREGAYILQMRNPGGVILAEPLDPEKNDNGIGALLETKELKISGDNDTENVEYLLLDRPLEFPEEPPADGSSLGKCISETSSVSNPATWLIPIGILIAAMGGAAVLFEDEFNAAAAEFNKAMPSLNIQRPAWMNQISRQLAEIDPAVPAAVLAVGIIGLGALALGLTYAACESGADLGSSKGGGSSDKDKDSKDKDKDGEKSQELTTAAEPSPANA